MHSTAALTCEASAVVQPVQLSDFDLQSSRITKPRLCLKVISSASLRQLPTEGVFPFLLLGSPPAKVELGFTA